MPDVPTAIESGLTGFEVTSWNGVFVRANTPPDIVNRLNGAINDVIGDSAVVAQLRSLGLEAGAGTAEALGQRLKDDIAKWSQVIKAAKIEPK